MLNTKKTFTKVLTFIGRFTLGTDMVFDINSSGNPYMRWTKSGTDYQIVIMDAGIAYQRRVGGGSWTDVFTNH